MHFVKVKGILSARNGMNVYRGCTHGCIYCDSRSKCYHMEHEFTDIEVKINAPELLEAELKRKRHLCMIGTGSMCDPYMHCEEEVNITGKCLEIIERYGFGAALLTKSDGVLRDADILERINRASKAVVQMTMTTYDDELCKKIEPRVCTTHRRYEVLKEMQRRGIPTVAWLCPILPFINDTEDNIRGLLDYCFDAGVKGIINFGIGLTLREGNREYFYRCLDRDFPGLKLQYIKKYGDSYECSSPDSARLRRIITEECEKHGVLCDNEKIFSYLSEFPQKEEQLSLF